MKRNGYTLVEVLAVLILLAIIFTIAAPRMLDSIDESKKAALKISATKLLDEARKEYSKSTIIKEYNIENKQFVDESLNVNGELPEEGSIKTYDDGTVSIAVHNDEWCAIKRNTEENIQLIPYEGDCQISTPIACFSYVNNTTYITITDYDDSCVKDVVIPSKIEGLPVTSIGSSAFSWNQLTSVVIPSSVTSIDSNAFYTNQLTSVDIPSSVTSIGSSAFSWNQLTSVDIPSSVTSIGTSAFYNNQLTSVDIPSSVTSIDSGAFSWNQLTSVDIPSSVTSIGYSAFSQNPLTSVVIPSSVTSIGSYAFSWNQLTSVDIPSSVTSIGVAAFNYNQLPDNQAFIYKRNSDGSEDKTTIVSYGGAKRDNVSIPNSVTSIGNDVFQYYQLTSVVIPSSVTSIGDYAFSWNQLTSVVIPSSVTLSNSSISPSFYTSYVTNNNKSGGTYTAPSQDGVWTKQP